MFIYGISIWRLRSLPFDLDPGLFLTDYNQWGKATNTMQQVGANGGEFKFPTLAARHI